MTTEEHPFLYRLLKSKIMHQSAFQDKDSDGEDDDKDDTDSLRGAFDEPVELDDNGKTAAKLHRAHVIAKTVCSMITFASNRRKNAMQLENVVTFTAHSALGTLGKNAERTIKNRMKLGPPGSPNFCPLICIDNLDFQEAVHVKSVENQSIRSIPTAASLDQQDPQQVARPTITPQEFHPSSRLQDPQDFILKASRIHSSRHLNLKISLIPSHPQTPLS
ncbi:hypothetical protein PTTG_28415 [Puccinia triticina 1-1 BBBD Race 1]|uniref:Uncharacterized protein n=1 Tax=Puccinia triticina (isolate 1-1 / race 1 (BBBD)) TaxID=630390 RepID=A0A180GBZ3_PUCT1|nr:hypothetical protein PTTG_28415 [Puccinia triticina 1-1 BBBD Race 1]